MYSEELITASLAAVKNQLTKILYPFVEASSSDPQVPNLLREVIRLSSPADSILRQLLSEIFQAVSSILPRINDLICADAMAMSESIIIQAVYIAIGPFFIVETETEGKGKKSSATNNALGGSAMRSLRLDALSLIRSVSLLSSIAGNELTPFSLDLRESRRPATLDHRGDPVILNQAVRHETACGPV